ncbi:MAG: hypothetical protein HY806_00430 [Nitrospirae bacterium]|nr:hypothetical protein [Nitrospirota bacterium]
MDEIAGGDYWKDIILNSTLTFDKKEERITESYMKQMGKFYSIVCEFPIKEKYHHKIPKYRLIYGTRHEDGILLMNILCIKQENSF